jgi:biopolymer transport protein TolR
MAFGGGGNKEVMSEINVTPLCDIFVVLLIIFMLAMDTMNQQGPAIDLPQRIDPKDHPPDAKEQDECNITIKDETWVWINGEQTTLEGLPAKLQDILPKTSKQAVMVRAAGEINLERAIKVIGIAQANGAKSVGLGTMIRQLNP